jgi:flavin reductase (DIM6/NTAB) family NADH-FMN oxidoreductase RutF
MGCRVHAIHEGGDHWIVVGQVVATYRDEAAGEPLVFFGGKYVGLQGN